MADILGDLIMRVKGDASGAKKAMDDTKGGLSGLVSPANVAKGAVMGVAGGLAMMGQKMVPLNEGLRMAETRMDATEDELRDMASGFADASFPLEDVVEGMDELSQRGVDSKEDMEALLPVIDDMTDALGIGMSQGIDKAQSFMSALGKDMEDFDENTAEMIHAIEDLTEAGLAPLEKTIQRSRDEFNELGLEGDDLVEVMVALDRNTSSSREAQQVLQDAIKDSNGDMGSFREIIEETTGDMSDYEKEVARAEGSMQDQAEIANESNTIFDELRERVMGVAFQYGGLLENLREVNIAIMALTPLIGKVVPALKGMASVIFKSVIPAIKAKIVALAPILGPAGILMALIGLLWVFRDDIVDIMSKAKEVTVEWVETAVEYWGGLAERTVQWGKDAVIGLYEGIRDRFSQAVDAVEDLASSIIETVTGLPGRMLEIGKDLTSGFAQGITRNIPLVGDAVADMIWEAESTAEDEAETSSPSKMTERIGNDIASGLAKGLEETRPAMDALQEWGDQVRGFFEGVSKDVAERINVITQIATNAQRVLASFAEQINDIEANMSGLSGEMSNMVEHTVSGAERGEAPQVAGASGSTGDVNVNVYLEYSEEIDYDSMSRKIEREVKRKLRRVQS